MREIQIVDLQKVLDMVVLAVLEMPGFPKWCLMTFRCLVAILMTLTTTLALVAPFLAMLALAIKDPRPHRFGLLATLLQNALFHLVGAIEMTWT